MLQERLPLVSIVTPSFNQGKFIEDTIRSVLFQDYARVEHIVVDGGSTDQTLAVLRKYDGRIQWISETDRGQADALNKGFRQLKGDIVGWINADDLYFDRHVISAAVEALVRHPKVGLVYGDFVETDRDGRLLAAHPVPDFDAGRLRRYNYIPQPTIFFRRQIANNYPLNTELEFALDAEWMLRIAQEYPFLRVPRVQAIFRRHSASKIHTLGWGRYLAESQRLHRTYPFEPRGWWWLCRLGDKFMAMRLRIIGWWWRHRFGQTGVPYGEFLDDHE